MAIPTFYHSELSVADAVVELSSSETSHALRSRRLKTGQPLRLINGKGLVAHGTIHGSERTRLRIELNDLQQLVAPSKSLTIAVAIPKGDRQRTMIDMLTQQGVTRIIALECEHSVTRFKNKMLEKWQRIAIESCKQSHNPWLPEILAPKSVQIMIDWLEPQQKSLCVYADIEGQKMIEIEGIGDHLVILIGPEGGFSLIEIETLNSAGIAPVKLANAILRTEAAAVTAAAQFFV